MKELILNYFSLRSIRIRLANRKISLFSFFDKNTYISSNALINRGVILRKCKIGAYSYIGQNCNFNSVEVGKYCSISKNINIGLATHPTNFMSTSPIFFSPINGTSYTWTTVTMFEGSPKNVRIGNDVWIGMNASILGGVTIGDGAIIAAHAMVTKDVPPFAIVGGVPAKVLRFRFNSDVVDEIIKLKWWDMPEESLRENIKGFQKEIQDLDSIIFAKT